MAVKRARVDWAKWRKRYVTSSQSLSELSRLPGAPSLPSLSRKSKEEDWDGQRTVWMRENKTQVDERVRTEVAFQIALDEAAEIAMIFKMGKAIAAKGYRALAAKDEKDLSARDAAAMMRAGVEFMQMAMGRNFDQVPDADKTVIVLPSKEG